METTHPTPSEVGASGPLATTYRERTTDHDPDSVSASDLKAADAVEFHYRSSSGRRQSKRGDDARDPSSCEKDVERLLVGHGDDRLAYSVSEQTLKSVNRKQTVTLAERDQIHKITTITYPKPVPVAGVVQEGVEITVFYRSVQSGNIKSKTLTVTSTEGRGNHQRIYAESSDTAYEMVTDRSREIELRFGDKRTLGRLVRVEFPEGHQYTMNIEGLSDDDATEIFGKRTTEVLERAVTQKLDTRDVNVKIAHEGRING